MFTCCLLGYGRAGRINYVNIIKIYFNNKMSSQYYETKRLPLPQYETMGQLTHCMTCPGSCSCNLGQRSNYDQMQFEAYVLGKNSFTGIVNSNKYERYEESSRHTENCPVSNLGKHCNRT